MKHQNFMTLTILFYCTEKKLQKKVIPKSSDVTNHTMNYKTGMKPCKQFPINE